MKFFTSDTHFCDNDTLVVDNRPFKNHKKFDKFVLSTWNKQARRGDTIYVIGDFVDCGGPESESWKKSIKYVQKIKADVVLIIGNNEERVIKNWFDNDFEKFKNFCIEIGFKNVYKNLVLEVCGQNFYLVHKPKERNENMLNLFGHMHRSCGLYKPFGFNVGCDLSHFRLLDENDIKKFLKMKEMFWEKDSVLNN